MRVSSLAQAHTREVEAKWEEIVNFEHEMEHPSEEMARGDADSDEDWEASETEPKWFFVVPLVVNSEHVAHPAPRSVFVCA